MIAIRNFKMPRGCYECQFADESFRMDCDYYCQAVKEKPDVQYGLNKPDWCPLVEVFDVNVGKCSEIPNSSDCISRQTTADEIGKRAERCAERFGTDDPFWEGLMIAKNIVECAPSVQPEIIHCKDCEYYETILCQMDVWTDDMKTYKARPNDFCSYANRKTEDG